MKFIKLTTPQGEILYVNIGLVAIFYPNNYEDSTTLVFDDEFHHIVNETPEEILELLNTK